MNQKKENFIQDLATIIQENYQKIPIEDLSKKLEMYLTSHQIQYWSYLDRLTGMILDIVISKDLKDCLIQTYSDRIPNIQNLIENDMLCLEFSNHSWKIISIKDSSHRGWKNFKLVNSVVNALEL